MKKLLLFIFILPVTGFCQSLTVNNVDCSGQGSCPYYVCIDFMTCDCPGIPIANSQVCQYVIPGQSTDFTAPTFLCPDGENEPIIMEMCPFQITVYTLDGDVLADHGTVGLPACSHIIPGNCSGDLNCYVFVQSDPSGNITICVDCMQ